VEKKIEFKEEYKNTVSTRKIKNIVGDDIADSEIENASIRLPLKKSDIMKLKLNKSEQDDSKKKMINIPVFENNNSSKKKNNKNDCESEELDDEDIKCNGKNFIGCKKKNKKILELKKIIKELSENVKTANGIDTKERTAVLSKLNIMNVVGGNKINLKNNKYNCQHCSESFDTIPCVIPEKYYKNNFYVFGWYCSFNCAAADIITLGGHNMWTRYSNLHALYKRMFGVHKDIKPADDKLVLEKNGGNKTIEQYRKDSLIVDKESRVRYPPMITILPTIENDYMDSENEIGNANICLAKVNRKTRLKRNKPLPQFGLVKSMGLKIKNKNDSNNH
jgi:hypothetical protein